MPELSTSTSHTSLTTGWGNTHLAISGVSHQPYVQTSHYSNASGPGGSGMQDNGAGNYDTGVDFETLKQQATRISRKEEEFKDLRDIRESVSQYTDNVTIFDGDMTNMLNNWRNTPIYATDAYNPPNATFNEASTNMGNATLNDASVGTGNVTFNNASVATDNVTFNIASTSTRSLEEKVERIKLQRKKALDNVNGKQVQTDFDPHIRVKEVKIQYPNDVKVVNKIAFSRKNYSTRMQRFPHKKYLSSSKERDPRFLSVKQEKPFFPYYWGASVD